jgi:superfamily I DNA/RNA helicase
MTVAISNDFVQALCAVEKSHMKQVSEFLEKFQAHPESLGLHVEPIQSARDKKFYSARVDQAYRAVIAKPNSSVYVLMWVDHHDDAYRWAERKQLTVNPETGALQVLDVHAVEAASVGAQEKSKAGALFAHVKDKHLLRLGVPEELLPLVRSMDFDADLEVAEKDLPAEAYEALYLLAAGDPVDQVLREMQKPEEAPAPVDTTNFAEALKNDDSQRRFYVVESAQELAEILAAPLEQWRIFLHPKQRQLVRMKANGPVRVLGGAGTGKTVTAMHRARYLAEEIFNKPDDRILLTTFTKNLATDISDNLRKLCTDEKAWARIEVKHLDGWVSNFLRTQGYRPEIVFDSDNDAWANAMTMAPSDTGLPEAFYRAEWEAVVQAQNITTLEQYLGAPRLGRGTRLSRDAKKRVWPVFQEYRALLNERGQKEYIDLVRDARQVIEARKLRLPYRAVIVDETQDMSAEALRLLRAMVAPGENDLFLVGDAHQRIYRHKVSLGKCGIDIRGRGKKLKINYRTTDEIRRFAVRLLEGRAIDDLDGGQDDQKGYMSLMHGEAPYVHTASSSGEEINYLKEYIAGLRTEGASSESICVVARTKKLLELYAANLRACGFQVYEIKRDSSEQRDRAGIRLATMHRVKGLEFDHVIVVAANKGVVPHDAALASADDQITERNLETSERALLYVTLTRAKKSALITAYGELSPYLGARCAVEVK